MSLELLIEDLKNRSDSIYDSVYTLIEMNGDKVEKKKLFFDIVDSDEINGRAWCNDEEDHVEINKGVIRVYYDLFLKINEYFKNNFLKRFISRESEEDIEKMSLEAIVFEGGTPVLKDSKKIVDDRAKLLEVFVFRFILLHEFGHIFNGHCSYLADKEKKNVAIPMYYTDNMNRENISALDIRTMEMDADMFAVTQSIWHLLFLYTDFDSQVQCEGIKPMDLFYWWAFAIRCHFLLCEDRFMDAQKYYEDMKHLPSNARWGMIADTATDIIENKINPTVLNTMEAIDRFFHGIMEAEKVFNELKYTSYSWYDELAENEQYEHYRNQVNENWNIVVEELKAYSRCPLFEE